MTPICTVRECGKPVRAKGLCSTCYARAANNGGDPYKRQRRRMGTGTITRGDGRLVRQLNGVTQYEHVRIAEAALGRSLPPGAVVHHADGDKLNNENRNLVICPSQVYHALLHIRLRAFRATGDPNKRNCKRCHQWDDPENLSIYYPSEAVHPACNRAHAARMRKRGH